MIDIAKVYLVFRSVDWESNTVVGVFSSEDKAHAKAKELAGNGCYEDMHGGYRIPLDYTTFYVQGREME